MRNNEQTVATKNTSTTEASSNPTIQFTELSDEDAIRVVGGYEGHVNLLTLRLDFEIERV